MSANTKSKKSPVFINKTVLIALIATSMISGLSGCASMGPGTLRHDRFDYNDALSDSWKEQILLNIVKLRYGDTPMFVDVAQIISGYSITGSLSANYTTPFARLPVSNFILGANTTYSDKPTIIYKPQTSAPFIKNLMTPITPASLLALIQSGYSAEFIFQFAIDGINGLENLRGLGAERHSAKPDFLQALTSLQNVLSAHAAEISIKKKPGDDEAKIIFAKGPLSSEIQNDVTTLRHLLKLDPSAYEFSVSSGISQDNPRDIAIIPRSVFHILQYFATFIDVPKVDLDEKRASPAVFNADFANSQRLHIRSSASEPTDAFIKVNYNDHWFYVENKSLASKRTFTLMMLFFTLANQSSKDTDAVVTVPSGGGN